MLKEWRASRKLSSRVGQIVKSILHVNYGRCSIRYEHDIPTVNPQSSLLSQMEEMKKDALCLCKSARGHVVSNFDPELSGLVSLNRGCRAAGQRVVVAKPGSPTVTPGANTNYK